MLVHGFQASRVDFFLIKSFLQIRFGVDVLISTANEGRTEDSIELQGKRLAKEVSNYLISQDNDFKITFIGHSLGGLLIRSALTFMENLEGKLHTYISLSTPHLGYLYSASTLIHLGLWVLNSWDKSECLEQISMQHSANVR